MGDSSPDLLEQAHTVVATQLDQLRALVKAGQQRCEELTIQVRQVERNLDETTTQYRFATERNLPTASMLAVRERELRQRHETLARQGEQARRSLKQLDQLVRQIDMSSATLDSSHKGEPADPWDQALRAQVITGREQERVRLAREIHDGPAQVLANTLMGLEQCGTFLQNQRLDRLGLMLNRLRDATREGLREVRNTIADLRPGRLAEHGLVTTMQDYVQRYSEAYNTQVTVEVDALPRLANEIEIVLYRIVQEALQNAHKHARNAAVRVQLTNRQGMIHLTIRDEGPGFDPHDVARRAGRESWGLTSMRERAELIGARFVVSSHPGHGTEVSVALPLPPTERRS